MSANERISSWTQKVISDSSNIYSSASGDRRLYMLAADLAKDFIKAFENPSVMAINLTSSQESEYDDQGGYYTRFSVGGEVTLQSADGENEAEVSLGYDTENEFENELDRLREECEVSEDDPIFGESLKSWLEQFGNDCDYAEIALGEEDFVREVMTDDHIKITRAEFESTLVAGKADVGSVVDFLSGNGLRIPKGMSEIRNDDGSMDYSESRLQWSSDAIAEISKHLEAGMPADARDFLGVHPVVAAIYHGNMDAYEALVAAGADLSVTNPSGVNLVGCVIVSGRSEMLERVIETAGGIDGTASVPNLLLAIGSCDTKPRQEIFERCLAMGMSLDAQMPDGRVFSSNPSRYAVTEDGARIAASELAKREIDSEFGVIPVRGVSATSRVSMSL